MKLQNEAKRKLSMSAAWGRMTLVLVFFLLGAQTGFAGGKGSAGRADADYQQRSGDDLDRQSHGKPPALAPRVSVARTGTRLNPSDPTGFRAPIITPKGGRRCREIGPVLA